MKASQRKASELAIESVPVAALADMAAPYNPRRISDHDLAAPPC